MVPGYLSLLSSIGDRPLEYWCKRLSRTGHVRKVLDADLLENVVEIQDSEQCNGTSILCPPEFSAVLSIELPILVVVVKNIVDSTRFCLRVQVVDDQDCSHRFQFHEGEPDKRANSRYAVISRVRVDLEPGWNSLKLDLSSLTQSQFKQKFRAVQRLEFGSGCRLRRVYLLDRDYEDREIPTELYHGFLDLYMLKWGVAKIQRQTQTDNRNRSKARSETRQTDHQRARPSADSDLLGNLQAKCDQVIDGFFKRESARTLPVVEFKKLARIKSYALPRL